MQFDNSWNHAIGALPMLRFGYRFDEFTTSLSFAASYLFVSESKASGLKNIGPSGSVNDLFVTVAVEQPFLKTKRVATGISLTYSRTPYQTWLLYNTIDQFLFIPEFFFAVHI